MGHDFNHASPLAHFDNTELLDALSTGVVVLDAHLCVVYANHGTQDLLGFGLNQVRGRPICGLFTQPAELTALLRRSLDFSEVCTGHALDLTPVAPMQGTRPPRVMDATVTPLEGTITGRHLLLELVDARMRQQLSRETEMLTRIDGTRLMARQLAHEIKNPLGGLRGAAQLLERELADDGQREYTKVIIHEADRLSALVDSMLGPTRPPQKVQLNIHELCEHVYRLLRSEAGREVTIERDYDPSLPEGMFDRDELIQGLLNIARNALQAVGGRGRIVLRTRVLANLLINAGRHRLVACVQIEDTGPGVPAELRDTLFMPLVTGKSEGTGLGLTVAQDMAARHGGIVEFESEPGRTIFSMLLPLENAHGP